MSLKIPAWGTDPYGGRAIIPARAEAISLDGHRIQVTFANAMNAADPLLAQPSAYSLDAVSGVYAAVLSIDVGLNPTTTTVIVSHTGTTLGGFYRLLIDGPSDVNGNVVTGLAVSLYAKGDAPVVSLEAVSGTQILVSFGKEIISPDVFLVSSWAMSLSTPYPVRPAITKVEPVLGDPTKALLTVSGMTSLPYQVLAGASGLVSWDGSRYPYGGAQATGIGNAVLSNGTLVLSRPAYEDYGWKWPASARPTPGTSSLKASVTLDASTLLCDPPAPAILASFTIEDGGVILVLSLGYDRDSNEILRIASGDFLADTVIPWSGGVITLSVVRNPRANLISFLVGDQPFLSTGIENFTGTSAAAPGVSFSLPSSASTVGNLRVLSVSMSASDTIYDSAWNLVHDVTGVLIGSPEYARDTITVAKGPMVKPWGDMIVAGVGDVSVLAQIGSEAPVELELAEVNPWLGTVRLRTPFPIMAPSIPFSIKVNYHWMSAPTLPFDGLNTEGLVLNAAGDGTRFEATLVLGPEGPRPQAAVVGHRWIGLEKEQTASLNSPTTLVLNQSPNEDALDGLEALFQEISLQWAYPANPTGYAFDSPTPWHPGTASHGETVLVLEDDSAAPWSPLEASVALFHQEADLSCPGKGTINARVEIASTEPDGVFTGVGIGLSDGAQLWFAGALTIDGFRHVGLLKDAVRPHLASSWVVGPVVPADVVSESLLSVTSAEGFYVGGRLRVTEGPQAGSYVITTLAAVPDNLFHLGVSPAFPSPRQAFDSGSVEFILEVPWDEGLSTWNLQVDTTTGSAQFAVSGKVSGLVSVLGSAAECPGPAQTLMVIPSEGKGQVLWGSISRAAKSVSNWALFNARFRPDERTLGAAGKAVNAEMAVLPEQDPSAPWDVTHGFGKASVSGGELLLQGDVASDSFPAELGYYRPEPLFQPDVNIDVSARFRAGTGCGQDAQIVLHDGESEVRLATLIYAEGLGGAWRRLLRMPVVSLAGGLPVEAQGWVPSGVALAGTLFEDALRSDTQGELGLWTGQVPPPLGFSDTTSRIIECRFQVRSVTYASGHTGIVLGTEAAGRKVQAELVQGGIQMGVGGPFLAAWDDGLEHRLRITVDAVFNTVVLQFDGVVLSPSLTLSAFEGGYGNVAAWFGADLCIGASSSVLWRAVAAMMPPPIWAHRTLGVFLGGDIDDIDSWELPRTDASTAPSSSEDAVIEAMDWRQMTEVRILRNPSWGVTVFRPDLALPPYYDPSHSDSLTEPSRGWINVEYARLPKFQGSVPNIEFGALDSRGVSHQRWDWLRYRLYKSAFLDQRAPRGMVLNQLSVSGSPDRGIDPLAEVVSVRARDSALVSLLDADMRAVHVHKVIDGATTFLPSTFVFDADTQEVRLSSGSFSAADALLQIVFIPGSPTESWMAGRLQSFTNLGEGTPPWAWSQANGDVRRVLGGDGTQDDLGLIGDEFDPIQLVTFENDPDAIWESDLLAFQDSTGTAGMVAIAKDELLGISFSGGPFADSANIPEDDTFQPWGTCLMVSGGSYACQARDVNGLILPGDIVPMGGLLGETILGAPMDWAGEMHLQYAETFPIPAESETIDLVP